MELLQILQKSIPQKKKIFDRFQKRGDNDLSRFLLQLIKSMKKDVTDMHILNAFFIELYDMVYPYIVFNKVKIARKIVRLLEVLSLPMHYVGENKWIETFKRLIKLKL